jgi:hypothetical protein
MSLILKLSFLGEITMQRKPLAVLINDLDQEMIRLGYTEGT